MKTTLEEADHTVKAFRNALEGERRRALLMVKSLEKAIAAEQKEADASITKLQVLLRPWSQVPLTHTLKIPRHPRIVVKSHSRLHTCAKL